MRIFAAALATETNTFLPIPTSAENFHEGTYFPPGENPGWPTMYSAPLVVARRRVREEGWTLIEGSCAWGEPAGLCARATYEGFRDEILGQLQAAAPVDGVLLGLHGTMVAHGYDDCEGDLIARAREIVGPETVIGVEHDPHCHLPPKRLEGADLLRCRRPVDRRHACAGEGGRHPAAARRGPGRQSGRRRTGGFGRDPAPASGGRRG